MFNCLANLLVMLGSLDLTGRIDHRLSNVMRRTAIFHGALAFLTLISRHYYSIPMLLTGAPLSAIGGAAVTAIRQRAAAPAVGIVGPWHWIAEDRALRCQRVISPDASIAGYSLLLMTFERPLPADWTPLLSRALLAGTPVRHIAEYLEEARGVVAIEHFDLEHLPRTGIASYRTPKRLLDLMCAMIALPLAAPVIALASLGIWMTMGRPTMFVQQRVGLGGVAFRMLKLRSIREPTPGDRVVATVDRDPRITALGSWLRRFRIDVIGEA